MPQAEPSSMYHHKCNTLLYSAFISIMCGQRDLTILIIQGTPTEDQLNAAWDNILTEYSELTTSEAGENIFQVVKNILITKWKILYVDTALLTLAKKYDAVIANRLVEVGFDFIQPLENIDAYLRQLEAVRMEANILIVRLNQYNAEYERLCPKKTTEPARRTEFDYQKELDILSKWYGSRIKKEEVTVFDVCSIMAAFMEYNKANNNNATRADF